MAIMLVMVNIHEMNGKGQNDGEKREKILETKYLTDDMNLKEKFEEILKF